MFCHITSVPLAEMQSYMLSFSSHLNSHMNTKCHVWQTADTFHPLCFFYVERGWNGDKGPTCQRGQLLWMEELLLRFASDKLQRSIQSIVCVVPLIVIGSGSMRRHVLCGPLSSPSVASRWGSFVVVYIFSQFVQQYPCLPSCTLYKHILKSLYKNTY